MNPSEMRSRYRKLFRRPQFHLAWSGLREAIKLAGDPLRSDPDGFVVLVIPAAYRFLDYQGAALELLGDDREDWFERSFRVRLSDAAPNRDERKDDVNISNLKGLSILLTEEVSNLPSDVRFAALAILSVSPPTARHIRLARRLSGRGSMSDEHALLLSRMPQNVLLAALYRKKFGDEEIAGLDELLDSGDLGPSLMELPGFDEAKNWAAGLAADVRLWRNGELAWSELTRGALVAGPPGSGKTFLAAALARYLGFRLVSTTVGEWQSRGALGPMLAAMRKSFSEAALSGGAVLFIDEIDAIGRRAGGQTGSNGDQYWHVVVSEFLSLLTAQREGVIVVGATNNPHLIDAAILRAGRLERRFDICLPDTAERAAMLALHAGTGDPAESFMPVAERLGGASAATVEELVRKARKRARDAGRTLEIRDLEAELPERIAFSVEQRFRLAVHEAGHALVALAVGHATRATIEIEDSFDPSACAYPGGMTAYELVEDHIPTESRLLDRIAVALGGMAAEAVVFGDRSIGSGGVTGSDIERATAIARRMVASYGFAGTPLFIGSAEAVSSTTLPRDLEGQMVGIIGGQYDRVLGMLGSERGKLVALAGDAVTYQRVSIDRHTDFDAA